MKNKYMPTAISLYINYFVHGMGAIIMAQNMDFLTKQLHTDTTGVAYVISALGIGRLLVLFVSGVLSDKFGRKPFVFTGMAIYALFFAGILVAPNVSVAFIFALLAGMANSILDSGTYPALMESFPETPGTANVIIKAFISAGQFALPLIISMLISGDLYYGYSFLLCIAIFIVNGLVLSRLKFPDHKVQAAPAASSESGSDSKFRNKPNFWIEGICLILIGYTATATFYLISVWLPKYGEQVIQMSKTSSLQLISYYSIGSLLAVFVTSYLVKSLVRPVTFVLLYPFISFVALLVLWQVRTPLVCVISAFVIGFSAAGGVLQLALTTMSELFPSSKGKITGIVYTASSLATFSIPVITGILSKTSISNIILFDAIVTFVGVLLAIIVNMRYRRVINPVSAGVQA
ncbi:Predicted arabinose efflux permease, MFS family [Paenibacillus sophorae]|uniref:MFS transporter n=1 Tax=Paenibacillus sophorae TaxID=1333845 RepID=A0A1H8T4L7_9BACL|nr:MFS transporter [Paenibacillus sophorae]QWU17078.1 MFS transporter [Paenibacillus sophorae]SEO85468.1 Predicted arabinose efflux permease, MFS family [Paenibacillus sophorae]